MEDTPSILGLIISWFPMILLLGMLFWFMRRSNKNLTSASGKGYAVLMEELIGEMRRQNDLLESVVKDQGERIRQLEEERN